MGVKQRNGKFDANKNFLGWFGNMVFFVTGKAEISTVSLLRCVTCAVTTESLLSDAHIHAWIFVFLSRNFTELEDKFRQR